MAGNNENEIEEIINFNESAVMSNPGAVSYTHLDVYKRQIYICVCIYIFVMSTSIILAK